ncbi:MAG TPA: hypothetical protein VFM72_01530 [Aequorivita sp.]|nr:hypothetical protein [Aequorivita sp.]
MEKYILIVPILFAVIMISCKNETKNEESDMMIPEESGIMDSDENISQVSCYKYTSAKDTVLLQMEKTNDEVAGTLSYNYFEKDRNDGTFEGKMIGDTLFADYTFGSEGSVSVREIMFVKKGDKFVEGFGEVEEVNGKMKFKGNAKFTLNETMPLQEINCDEN